MSLLIRLYCRSIASVCIAFAIVLGHFARVSTGYNIHAHLNENNHWRCIACENEHGLSHREIFGMVRRALVYESREVYLNFDHSWIDDRILRRRLGSAVEVYNVHRDQLADFSIESSLKPPDPSIEPMKEVFKVVISFNKPKKQSSSSAHKASSSIDWLGRQDASIIETFLTRNPCWIPLKDPFVLPILNNNSQPTFDKDYILANTGPPVLYHDAYDNAAIFIRLPNQGFAATCAFYSYITHKQFPATCPKPKVVEVPNMHLVFENVDKDLQTGYENYMVFHLGEIGWANNIHNFMDQFRYALKNDQIMISPRSQGKNEHTKYVPEVKLSNGSIADIPGQWYPWVDIKECPRDVLAWNPWNCHFMSISSCNNEETHNLEWNWRLLSKRVPSGSYKSFMEGIHKMRMNFKDAPLLELYWIDVRIQSFLQRPNIYTRAFLRWSIKSFRPLSSASTMAKGTPDADFGIVSNPKDVVSSEIPTPCISIHVRHGDYKNDFRGRSTLNRTLAAHVECMANLSIGFDVNTVVLASDDAKVISDAATNHSTIRWYSQDRNIPVFDGRSFNYFKEKSNKKDLANLLADMIVPSRCVGLVGTGDSAYTHIMQQYMCGRSSIGECPPYHKLWACQPDAKM